MAPTRKAKSKSKAQDPVLDQPAFKQTQQKSASSSPREIEAILSQRNGSSSGQTAGTNDAGPSNSHYGSPVAQSGGSVEAGPSSMHRSSPAASSALTGISASEVRKLRDDNARLIRRLDALDALATSTGILRESSRIVETVVQRVERTADSADTKALRAVQTGERVEIVVADVQQHGAKEETVNQAKETVDEVKETVDEVKETADAIDSILNDVSSTVDETKEIVDRIEENVAQQDLLQTTNDNVLAVYNIIDPMLDGITEMDARDRATVARLDRLEESVNSILQILHQRLPTLRYH